MSYDKYIETLKRLTPAQLVVEVSIRLHEFNRAEQQRKAWDVIEDARQMHRLAQRELDKRGEPRR